MPADLAVVSWNVDGLERFLDPSVEDRTFGRADVVCLQEVRVRPRDVTAVAALEGALPGWRCWSSLADDPHNAAFRGGRAYGVATYVRADHRVERVPRPTWDREGRVAIVVLEDHRLAVVNVYAVNGTSKPWYDPEGAVDGDRHAFKRRFVRLLAEEARALIERGLEVVLVGDWNVSRTRLDTWPRLRTEAPHALARAEFEEHLVRALGLVDVFRHLHPEERRYTWFARGTRGLDAARVDYALLGSGLVERVTEAWIGNERGRSDHVPLGVRIRARSG